VVKYLIDAKFVLFQLFSCYWGFFAALAVLGLLIFGVTGAILHFVMLSNFDV